jgi:hypothetical protein
VQNGAPMVAQRHLDVAVATLDTTVEAAPTEHPSLPEQRVWSDYQDAALLNAMGVRLGKVTRLQASTNGSAAAVLTLGGAQDVLGLFDIGGIERIVPADTLLFGKRQTIGAVRVVLPTIAASASQIEHMATTTSNDLAR